MSRCLLNTLYWSGFLVAQRLGMADLSRNECLKSSQNPRKSRVQGLEPLLRRQKQQPKSQHRAGLVRIPTLLSANTDVAAVTTDSTSPGQWMLPLAALPRWRLEIQSCCSCHHCKKSFFEVPAAWSHSSLFKVPGVCIWLSKCRAWAWS